MEFFEYIKLIILTTEEHLKPVLPYSQQIRDIVLALTALVGIPLLISRTRSANLSARAAKEKSISERYIAGLDLLLSEANVKRAAGVLDLQDTFLKQPSFRLVLYKMLSAFIQNRAYIPYDYDLSSNDLEVIYGISSSEFSRRRESGDLRARKRNGRWQISKSSARALFDPNNEAEFDFLNPNIDIESAVRFLADFDVNDVLNGIGSEHTKYRFFKSISLANLSLNDLDFSDFRFTDCDFRGTNLQGSKFHHCSFSKCKFEKSFLGGADFSNSTFKMCTFRKTRFRIQYSAEYFTKRYRVFLFIGMLFSTMRRQNEASISKSTFQGCTFLGIDMSWVNHFWKASFENSKVEDSYFPLEYKSFIEGGSEESNHAEKMSAPSFFDFINYKGSSSSRESP